MTRIILDLPDDPRPGTVEADLLADLRAGGDLAVHVWRPDRKTHTILDVPARIEGFREPPPERSDRRQRLCFTSKPHPPHDWAGPPPFHGCDPKDPPTTCPYTCPGLPVPHGTAMLPDRSTPA